MTIILTVHVMRLTKYKIILLLLLIDYTIILSTDDRDLSQKTMKSDDKTL